MRVDHLAADNFSIRSLARVHLYSSTSPFCVAATEVSDKTAYIFLPCSALTLELRSCVKFDVDVFGFRVTTEYSVRALCTLRMWFCMKWHGAWFYGVHRTRRDGSSFMWHQPCQCCKYTTSVGSGDSSVVRAPDSWSKGRGFESRQERRENFLLRGQLSVLALISVSVPPLCYRSST